MQPGGRMKRWMVLALLLVFSAQTFGSAEAAGKRRRSERKAIRHRTVVVVHHGWPLRRPLRRVYVRPARVPVRNIPSIFLAPVVFTGTAVAAEAAPTQDVLVWQDNETVRRVDDWTEVTLNCQNSGTKLWLEVATGKAQLDWAEVVFENGETRVVDFNEKAYGPGLYSILDFSDGRRVDHVRIIARARSDAARIVLQMQK
jgi:hypothetical protein